MCVDKAAHVPALRHDARIRYRVERGYRAEGDHLAGRAARRPHRRGADRRRVQHRVGDPGLPRPRDDHEAAKPDTGSRVREGRGAAPSLLGARAGRLGALLAGHPQSRAPRPGAARGRRAPARHRHAERRPVAPRGRQPPRRRAARRARGGALSGLRRAGGPRQRAGAAPRGESGCAVRWRRHRARRGRGSAGAGAGAVSRRPLSALRRRAEAERRLLRRQRPPTDRGRRVLARGRGRRAAGAGHLAPGLLGIPVRAARREEGDAHGLRQPGRRARPGARHGARGSAGRPGVAAGRVGAAGDHGRGVISRLRDSLAATSPPTGTLPTTPSRARRRGRSRRPASAETTWARASSSRAPATGWSTTASAGFGTVSRCSRRARPSTSARSTSTTTSARTALSASGPSRRAGCAPRRARASRTCARPRGPRRSRTARADRNPSDSA